MLREVELCLSEADMRGVSVFGERERKEAE